MTLEPRAGRDGGGERSNGNSRAATGSRGPASRGLFLGPTAQRISRKRERWTRSICKLTIESNLVNVSGEVNDGTKVCRRGNEERNQTQAIKASFQVILLQREKVREKVAHRKFCFVFAFLF